jgi:hypothetical protein
VIPMCFPIVISGKQHSPVVGGRSPTARGLEENRAPRRQVTLADPEALHLAPVVVRQCVSGRRRFDVAGLFAVEDANAVAARRGLSRAHVHRIAAGEIRRPSYETVARLEKLPCAFGSGPTADVTRNS